MPRKKKATKKKVAKKPGRKPGKKKVIRNKDGSIRKKSGRKPGTKVAKKKKKKTATVASAPPKVTRTALRKKLASMSETQLREVQSDIQLRLAGIRFENLLHDNPDLVVEREKNPKQFGRFYTSLVEAVYPRFGRDSIIMGSYMRAMCLRPETAGTVVVEARRSSIK